MNKPIRLAQANSELEQNRCKLQVKHEDFSDGGVDTLVCSGEKSWQVGVKTSMSGYGMFMGSWLFDLGWCIGFVQLYEHSRGGHRDPSISIIDFDGALRGTVYRYSGDFSTAAFDEKRLWLLHTDRRQYSEGPLRNFSGSCLMQINLATGKVESEKPIRVPERFFASQHLAHSWLTTIGLSALHVAIAQAANQVVLDISVVNYQREKTKEYDSLQIPLAECISGNS